ncbi:MAG: endonuclease domain-containing protein [Alphaproteobacteria bacterium]
MRGRKPVQDRSSCAKARPTTVPQARALRRNAPETERLLWKLLRDRRLEGLKFRRQGPLGPYVLDFVCLRHRLVIEADGPFHEPAQDALRDAWLAAKGFRVLRFPNTDIQLRDWQVIARILEIVGTPPPQP